jgi:hypothetical protein
MAWWQWPLVAVGGVLLIVVFGEADSIAVWVRRRRRARRARRRRGHVDH